jgi:hypothetical protein
MAAWIPACAGMTAVALNECGDSYRAAQNRRHLNKLGCTVTVPSRSTRSSRRQIEHQDLGVCHTQTIQRQRARSRHRRTIARG